MSGFTVTVTDQVIRQRFSDAGKRKALATLMPNVKSDTENYVPYRTGQLNRSLDPSQFEEGIIAWRTPYASIVYNMPAHCNWTRTRHPMAGNQWMERSHAVNGERWRKIIAFVYNGGN